MTVPTFWRVKDADADTDDRVTHLKQLTVQLPHHDVKEERILYPAADAPLSPAATKNLQPFLDTGELPDGWVCIKTQ